MICDSSQTASRAFQRCLRSTRSTACIVLAAALALSLPQATLAQTPSANSVPVNPAAAAGMTTGLTGGMNARDVELMQVRAAAQAAEGDAFAASMARTAERSLDENSRQRTLQSAREEKAIKQSMAERMKWERASAQVQKVSANDMSTWRTESGSVRVERNVPDPFLTSLIEEERQLAARQAAASADRGSGPIAATRRALSWRPFSGGRETSEELSMAANAFPVEALEGRSVSALVSRSGSPASGEPNAALAEPQFASAPASGGNAQRPSPTPAAMSNPGTSQSAVGSGRIPQISGAELVDGRSPVAHGGEAPRASAPGRGNDPVLSQPSAVSAELPGDAQESEGGFFSRFRSSSDRNASARSSSDRSASARSGGSSGGLFGIGRRRSPEPADLGGIDARLFPADAPSVVPDARRLGGSSSASSTTGSGEFASSAPSSIELPGGREEPEQRRGLSIPRPSLSMPSIPTLARSDSGGSGGGVGVPTASTINSAGNDHYVVTASAQFMVYGDDPLQSEIRALSAGTVVRMVKAGDQWASIRLPGGEEGVVQNKFLRAASSSEATMQ